MVTGRIPMTRGERLLAAGAPYAKALPALARTVGYMASMINSEAHYDDSQINSQDVDDTTGRVDVMTLIAVGDTDTTRTGNKILAKDITIRGRFERQSAATWTSAQIRLMLIVDKEYDGATPTVANILQTTGPNSPMNQDYSKRFVVLSTRTYTLYENKPVVEWKMYKKLPFHIDYDGTAATAADCKENQVLLVAISNIGTASNPPEITYYSRFKWYDN